MDVANAVHTVSYSMLTVTWCRSECCVPSGLDFEAAGGSVVCYYCFVLRASSHCKHDMGALSWLNAEAFERAPIPLFGRLVRCSTHGLSFTRLWYYEVLKTQVVHTSCHTCPC